MTKIIADCIIIFLKLDTPPNTCYNTLSIWWKEGDFLVKRNVLAEIKKDLDSCIGKTIHLRANRGRRKIIEREGILEQTYPNIFVIKLHGDDNSVRRVSFSYADILTETVELTVYHPNREPQRIAK